VSKLVHVLMGENGRAEKIFRDKSWRDYPEGKTYITTKAEAVKDIREQIFERATNPLTGFTECDRCGRLITWESGEMNERIAKGSAKQGEVSISNCEALCNPCHREHHSNRRWQTSKLRDPNV
jgi:hypothetical protein